MSESGDSARTPETAAPQGEVAQTPAVAPATPDAGRTGAGRVMRKSLPRTTRDNDWAAGSGIEPASAPPPDGGDDPSAIHAAAGEGIATPGGPLPHRAQLEGAFGLDLSSIIAHSGPDAQASAEAMGASGYATGNHVVVPPGAGVGLVAHEVTHVLQQQEGVHLSGGVDGGAGDPLEQEADSIGGAVARGESVAGRFSAPSSGGRTAHVQRDTRGKEPAKDKPLSDAEKTEVLNRARVDRATAGLTLLGKRWGEKMPALATPPSEPLVLPIGQFKQDAYNLLVVDRIDLSPVLSVLDAPGRENHARALGEALMALDRDLPLFPPIKEDITSIVDGGPIQRVRTRLVSNHALLSPLGKRALFQVGALGFEPLNNYFLSSGALNHGTTEDERLGLPPSYKPEGGWQATLDGRGIVGRPGQVLGLIQMIRSGNTPIDEKAEGAGPPAETPESLDPDTEGKAADLAKAIETAIAIAEKAAAEGKSRALQPADVTTLSLAIEKAGAKAREKVFADAKLMGHLALALDKTQSKAFFDKLDPIEQLYKTCESVRAGDEDPLTESAIQHTAAWEGRQNARERYKLKAGGNVFGEIRRFLLEHTGKQHAALRLRIQDHTKLKDDFIDRLQPEEQRKIYRLIHRGTEDPTPEDKVHEAAAAKKGDDLIMALRELAGSDPVRLKDLEKDMVFRTAALSLTEPVKTPDGLYLRPDQFCLRLWGIDAGDVESTDPGTLKLTEVDPTGDNKPLTMDERLTLEEKLFGPCIQELNDEITGKNDKKEYTTRGDQQMRRDVTRHMVVNRPGDPQAVSNILVNYDRIAAQPDVVALLRREHVVFGREIERRYLERYGVELRQWIYDNSGPVNRSGANRVLGNEQGAAVGMFNGKMLMAGEMDQAGKMTLAQALREHSFDGRPITEWASVSSRVIASQLGDKQKLLEEWRRFKAAVDATAAEIKTATGINIRAIDLLRNAYMEHTGHFQTNLEARYKDKPDDLAAIKTELGLTADVDLPPDAPPPSVEEMGHKMYKAQAEMLWSALAVLQPKAQLQWYSLAGTYMKFRFLPRIPNDPSKQAVDRPAEGQEGYTIEEVPPRSFNQYYRLQYGTFPDLHAAAQMRAMGDERAVSVEAGASALGIDAKLVTGEWVAPQESPAIGPHNRNLVRADFDMAKAKETAAEIWNVLLKDSRFDTIQDLLGRFLEEEQRLIRAEFRRLSGGIDLTFYIRQAIDERERERARRAKRQESSGNIDYDLLQGNWQYEVKVGTEGTSAGKAALKDPGDHTISTRASDAQLEQMLAISMSGNLDVRTRLRAACKRDAWSEIKQIVDELTVDERKLVLQDGPLMNEIYSHLEQYDDERVYKVLTGQGDLADRLYSRSHGGSWSERHLWGGTDEEGMRKDIKNYLRQLRLKYNAEIRAQAGQAHERNPNSPPIDPGVIDREVDRRVVADGMKLASDSKVRAIFESELTDSEKAEMTAMLQNPTGEARDWAVAGGAGKNDILSDIRQMKPDERLRRLNDPNYMQLLGERLKDEKDYRDAVNALKEGTSGGNDGLSKLDEHSRSGAQTDGSNRDKEETLRALMSLSPSEFEALQNDPKLQLQVLSALDEEGQAVARAYLAGPGNMPLAIETAGKVQDEAWGGGEIGKRDAASGAGQAVRTESVIREAKPGEQVKPDPAAEAVDPAVAQKAAEDKLIAERKEKYVRFMVHQAIHRLMGACRTRAGWSVVLEEAVNVYKLDLPVPAHEEGEKDMTSPRRVIWDAVAPPMAGFGAYHDAAPFEMTKQHIDGAEMKKIVRLAVLGLKDPSDDLVAAKIVTVDEQIEEEEFKKKQNNGLTATPGFIIKKDHVVAEDDLKTVVSSASDDHVIHAWSTYLAAPPGGSKANTMKARYDEYRDAFKAALPALKARYQAPAKEPPKPAKKPAAPTQAAVGGKDMEGAIDAAGDQAKDEAEPTPRAPLGPLDGKETDPLVAQMMLTRAKFIQFQVAESADFETLLRPYMGDDRTTTAAGSYNPSANKLSVSKNKRYNNLVESLLSRITQVQPGSVATALQMEKDDRWLLETGLRDESAQMALSMQKNLRYSGLQRDVGSTGLAEKETLDVTTFLLNHTFATASADYQIDSQEKDTLAYRRSENDRARDSYKAALETAAMWASLITSVLLTVAATILTGGLALGPLGAMAIGGVTMLLSAHAQAAVNKEILKDEFDTKDKADLVAREVMTGLVTMGTTFFAQGILSVAGKGMRLVQQAAGIKAVLGKPPSLWQMFLREASEEVTSELADNYVQAHLEATNPEHWVDGYKMGAKKAAAASDAILKSAGDNAFTAAVTSIVTAGIGKLRGGHGHGAGHGPEFEVPSAGRKRQVNLRKNLKQAFGDPEEKFTAAAMEWLMNQAQNGSIDWDNAPADLLQGLLQEYKEVGHEAHIASANAGMRARKVDRQFARHGHLLTSEAEVTEYRQLTDGVDDATPFVTVQDYARIRTEVAVAGLQAHEAQNGPLTTLQRDEFVKWVREAKGNDDLQERARRDPMTIDRVKYADVNAGANTAVGKPITSAETAARVMRDLADGNVGSLHELGIQVPPGFDPTKNEWGLGRLVEPNGKISYILIRGEGSAVNWEGFPGVEPLAHSHPDKGPDGRQSNHLKNLDASGGISLVSLVTTDGPNRIHFLPSGADLVFCLRHGIQEHTVFTPFQSLGNGMVGNPKPGANNAGINIVIKTPSLYGYMLGNRESPVAQVQIEIWAAGGSGPLHTMTLYGSDHLGGSWLYDTPPGQREGVERADAGGAAGAGSQRTPAGEHDGGGPVPTDIHDGQDDPSQRPTQVVPAQTDPSQRPTQVVPAQTDPSHRPTQVIPAQTDPNAHQQHVDPSQRPTGQFPAVDPNQHQGPPSMPDVAQPTPTGNRPARPAPQQRVINRTALSVFDEVPQLAEIESVQAEAMVSGGHVLRRAQHAMQAMSDHDYQGFKALVQSHQSPVARAFLFKAVAAGNTMSDVYWLSDQISGQDDAWMIDHLTLGDPRAVGGGIQQQWSTSCNAATTLTVRGNYDPVFALKFRQSNAADPMGTNAAQAQIEREMLESQYGGNWQNVPKQGQAVAWDMPGGIGRAADDLLNKHSTHTGLDFTPHVPATQSDAVSIVDHRLREGMQVPVILGGDGKTFAHYVLAMQRREGPNGVEFLMHDPGGQSRWISAADIAAGRADLFGYSKIDGLDVPSDMDSPADEQQVEAGGAPGANRRDDQQNQNQHDQQNQVDPQQGEQTEPTVKKGRGLPEYAMRLSDVIRNVRVLDDPANPSYFGIELPYIRADGRPGELAGGGVKRDVNNGQPYGHPDFFFDSTLEMGSKEYAIKLYDDVTVGPDGVPVGVGEHTPLSRLALSLFVDKYTAKFGKPPDSLGGSLGFHNKLYFQQEFFKNRQKGMTTDEAAVEAVKNISYGEHRAAVGYDDFEVLIDRTSYQDIALGKDKLGKDLGTQNVPTKIEVIARRRPDSPQGGGSSPGPAPHQGPGGPLEWISNLFTGGEQQQQGSGAVDVAPTPAPAQGTVGAPHIQHLAQDLGGLLQRDPDHFVKRYREEMAELDDHELAELNKLLRETRIPPSHNEAHLPPAKLIELHKKRLTALKEIGAFDAESFHGSRSEMLEGLAATGGEIVPAAELQRRGLTMQTGEGNKFTPNAAPKEFVSIGQGEAGFGTSMAYADMSQQLAHYNVKLLSYEDLQSRVTRLDFIVGNFDSIDVQIGGPFAMLVVKQKAHFVEERDKLQRELNRRNALPANSPGRRGGPDATDNYPVLFEFDLAGSGVRVEQRSDTKAGEALHGEASAYGPIDLKTALRRVYAPAAKLGEVRAKLSAMLGHDNFEVIAMEAVGELPNPGMIGQTRAATFKGLAEQEKEFDYAERAYERAAREGRPLDMALYFEERSKQ